jgi:hypothetical protein
MKPQKIIFGLIGCGYFAPRLVDRLNYGILSFGTLNCMEEEKSKNCFYVKYHYIFEFGWFIKSGNGISIMVF